MKNKIPDECAGGDCFTITGRAILDDFLSKDNEITLVHGIVTGRGKLEGHQFSHAWLEDGEFVIDNANNNKIFLPTDVYYQLGKVEYTVRYAKEEALSIMLESGYFGPWDETIKRSL